MKFTSATMFSYPSFPHVLTLSIAIRVILILYSEWHDAHSLVKYTDVDYRVFTDAAAFLLSPGPGDTNRAKGPIKEIFGFFVNVGDPYTRETYRYTPLLALLLTPNGWLHPSFGKYLFSACDIINGILIYLLLISEVLPRSGPPAALTPKDTSVSSTHPATPSRQISRETLATIFASVHLLNPLIFSISTRGSSESVLSLFIILTLYAALKGHWDASAVLLGLSTHWKIYPVIYGVGCLGVVGTSPTAPNRSQNAAGLKGFIRTLVNRKTIRFGLISAGSFIILGAGCYALWGFPFLYESYLYHLHRLDHRHNFSPYFYLTYLTYPSITASSPSEPITLGSQLLRSPLTSFVPQMTLALGTGLIFGRRKEDLVFTWFVQTVVFVVFNKVCTSQYFLWYLLLLPLLLPRLSMSRRRAGVCFTVWIAAQALWLAEAYRLEFLGQNVFFGLWLRGLVYIVGNCWVLMQIMESYS